MSSVFAFGNTMKRAAPAFIVAIALFALSFQSPLHAKTGGPSVRVMSFNIYRGGEMRGQPLSQTAKVIQEAKADIVGVQETKSPRGVNAERLAQLLGWNYYEDHWDCILTRFEIVERLKGDKINKGGVKVRLPSGQEAYVFNLHLPSNPYQPYQLLGIRPKWHKHWDTPFIKTEAEAIDAARKARGLELSALLTQIRSLSDQEAPVFVVGDFNEPSHLDWTEAAAKSTRHPIKVEYPTSLKMADAGFTDTWRQIYPDEMGKPGFTWTPTMKADDPTTHHDRIDFVYFKGKGVELNGVKVVGESHENADIVVSPYPSDHRAVVASFMLPAPLADARLAVRIASYNVEFGKNATPEQIGRMFKPYDLDMIGFDEVPDGDWTARVGQVLGMSYSYVGRISSANHKDKYKSILSRTPLKDTTEHELRSERQRSWNPASAVRAVTEIDGLTVAIYSLHISASGKDDGHAYKLASAVLPKETAQRIVIVGDFNNRIGDAAMDTIEAAGMRPTWKDLNTDLSSQFTYNALDPEKNAGVIDHILYNTLSGANATDGGIIELDNPLSDHKPVWAEIAFPREIKNMK